MAREEFRVVVPTFWTNPEVKKKLTREQKHLALYYFTSPHSKGSMTGVYYCPIEYVASEADFAVEEIRRSLVGALKPFVSYDEETEEVFVHAFAKHNVGEELKVGAKGEDNRIEAIRRQVGAIHSTRLARAFLSRYNEKFRLGMDLPESREAPSEALASPSEAIPCHVTSSHLSSVAMQPTRRAEDDPTDGQIMASIREHLYAPDGKPPEGWAEGREFSIMRELRKLGKSGTQIQHVVEGLGCLLRDGRVDWLKGKATLRAVHNSKNGVLEMWGQAEDAYYKLGATYDKRSKSSPQDIRSAIQRELAQARKRGA